jgi:cytidine deaminase
VLSPELAARLLDAARQASRKAYCPYSKFPVGAAVLGGSGAVYAGSNVENASYGLTNCAERSAVFRAVAEGEKAIAAVVVFTPTPAPTAPCGACRQVLNEFGPAMDVLCACDGPGTIRATLESLLPQAFGPKNLAGGAAGSNDEWTAE